MNRIVRWLIKRWVLHKVRLIRKETSMDIKSIAGWLVNLKVVPAGWLTKAGGWLGIVSAAACMFGHPIPFLPCASDPLTSLTAGLIGVGLGRRGNQ